MEGQGAPGGAEEVDLRDTKNEDLDGSKAGQAERGRGDAGKGEEQQRDTTETPTQTETGEAGLVSQATQTTHGELLAKVTELACSYMGEGGWQKQTHLLK